MAKVVHGDKGKMCTVGGGGEGSGGALDEATAARGAEHDGVDSAATLEGNPNGCV